MTKKEKLRVYNDCVHEIGTLQNGNNVMFCEYKKPWKSEYLTVEKEHDYYIVDNYILTNFLEVVAIACRHCLKKVK